MTLVRTLWSNNSALHALHSFVHVKVEGKTLNLMTASLFPDQRKRNHKSEDNQKPKKSQCVCVCEYEGGEKSPKGLK